MYALYNTFSNHIISRHRTAAAAFLANRKLQLSLTGSSYIPTTIKRIVKGELVCLRDWEQDEVDALYSSSAR